MNTTTEQAALTASTLTKSQRQVFGPKRVTIHGRPHDIRATVRFDDECGNGHNSFSITGDYKDPGQKWDDASGGCIHEKIAKHFPKLAPFIKWHLTSTDGPMHYVANTIFHAGDRDCHGLRKGEFRQLTDGKTGLPAWILQTPKTNQIDAAEKPAAVLLEWEAWGRTGDGKAREFDLARSCAVWLEATDEELSAAPEELKAKLLARLPGLMLEFKAAVESLGFKY